MKFAMEVKGSLTNEWWMKGCSMMNGCRNEVYYEGEGEFNEIRRG